MGIDQIERSIYAVICRNNGIKAREIAKTVGCDRKTVNHWLYSSPFMQELCRKDGGDCWHGMIRQARPHRGLGSFCAWYSTAGEFMKVMEEDPELWFRKMLENCGNIGRNTNDTRGLFHSFRDCGETMRQMFLDLREFGAGKGSGQQSGGQTYDPEQWEIAFELRLNKSKYIRIYADVLVITERYVFSLEFKMKDRVEQEELKQAAKYVPYLEVIFGPEYDVIPALVLTGASDLYRYVQLEGSTAEVPAVAGDMLFDLFDEYLGFL